MYKVVSEREVNRTIVPGDTLNITYSSNGEVIAKFDPITFTELTIVNKILVIQFDELCGVKNGYGVLLGANGG
jgi:hypothetical protein